MAEPIIRDLVVILGVSIAVVISCLRFHLPASVGFLITGIISGPKGFGIIKAENEVEILAEIGIALLLFGVGIEFSLKRFLKNIRQVLVGGGLQVGITLLAGFAVALVLQRSFNEAIFFGAMLSLSSTAIVLNVLQERDELKATHGQLALSFLIFQDIIVMFMVVLLPLLVVENFHTQNDFWWSLLKALGVLAAALASAYWIVPRLLFETARTRNSTLFAFVGLFLCLAIALLTSQLGLTLALGAFLSGLVISESEYGHQVQSHILPFQEILTSFFFLSVGMLLDAQFLLDHPILVVAGMFGVMLLKATIATFAAVLLGFPLRSALLAGIALSQVGEFSFLLAKNGLELGFTGPFNFQLFLAVTLLTMAITPFLPVIAPKLSAYILKLPWPHKILVGFSAKKDAPPSVQSDHVLLIGLGKSGKNIAQALRLSNVEYLALDINPELVHAEKRKGEPIFYGDATHKKVLQKIHTANARVAAVMVDDISASQRIVSSIRDMNPRINILVRVNRMANRDILCQLGANEIIADEFEASVEVIRRLLNIYDIDRGSIKNQISALRTKSSDGFIT